MAEFGDAEDVGADGGDVHERPVEGVPVGFDHGVGAVFHEVEYDAAKVDDGEEDGYVGDEEVGDFAVGHPGDDDGYAVESPDDGEEPQGNP